MDATAIIQRYLERSDWGISENSNITYSLQGLQSHLAGCAMREYWLDKSYPAAAAQVHRAGELHLHDLQVLGCSCNGWDSMTCSPRVSGGHPARSPAPRPGMSQSSLGQMVYIFHEHRGLEPFSLIGLPGRMAAVVFAQGYTLSPPLLLQPRAGGPLALWYAPG